MGWLLLASTLFTAGLLRQNHTHTPSSPFVLPIVGSALFAAILLLLLVTALEARRGGRPGPGVRIGSLTPLMLMLLGEKWFSTYVWLPLTAAWARDVDNPALVDPRFRAGVGVGLLLVAVAVAPLSWHTARKVWRRARPARIPAAAAATAVVALVTTGVIFGAAWITGADVHSARPARGPLLAWVLGGQGMLALAEELFFRGLLLSEIKRLAPRLGVRRAPARRWLALGLTSLMFGLEHLAIEGSPDRWIRESLFVVSLGLLLGMLVLLTGNLYFAAGVHAWINWLLLGAVPHLRGPNDVPWLPSGLYVGLSLAVAFVLALGFEAVRRLRRQRRLAAGG